MQQVHSLDLLFAFLFFATADFALPSIAGTGSDCTAQMYGDIALERIPALVPESGNDRNLPIREDLIYQNMSINPITI